MSATVSEFQKLTDAEQYFEFFKLTYDPHIVNVNRLHILKRLSQSIRKIDEQFPDLNEAKQLELYQEALEQAYAVFLSSSGIEQKLFKVFHQKPHNVVLLSEIGAN